MGDVGSRWLRLNVGAAHHGLAPGAQVGPLGHPRRWREVAQSATQALGLDADSGARARRQVQAAANSPNLLCGWPFRTSC